MSRIGKKPIAIPGGVTATTEDGTLTVKGPKGTLTMARPAGVEAKIEDGHVVLSDAEARDQNVGGEVLAEVF